MPAEVVQPDDILMVACSSESSDGAFGESLATSFQACGARGIVLDVGCRDALKLTDMQFLVCSRAISAKGTAKAGTVG